MTNENADIEKEHRRCTPCLNKRHDWCDPATEWCECPCDTGELKVRFLEKNGHSSFSEHDQ